MRDNKDHSRGARLLIVTASLVIVIAGIRAADTIVIPFLLSILIAIVCINPLFWLQRRGVPTIIAVILVVVSIMAVSVMLTIFVGTSLKNFSRSLPAYQKSLHGETTALREWLQKRNINISEQILQEYFDPGIAMQMVANMLSGLGAMLTNTFLILLTVIFILLEASGFPDKLRAAIGNPTASLSDFSAFIESVHHYLVLKTVVSIFTGISITIGLLMLKIDYPLLWGLVAFLLNYVPNIGSIFAAVPAVLLAIIQFGAGTAFLVALEYAAVNIFFGNFVEPRLMGERLGLSTLVVFLSLVFWGWVLGPVGMLLSVPLTMILKIALESNEDTRWIAILLGSSSYRKIQKALEEK
ncbi:MAG: AI-2E family transporter [bacterium]